MPDENFSAFVLILCLFMSKRQSIYSSEEGCKITVKSHVKSPPDLNPSIANEDIILDTAPPELNWNYETTKL